MKIKKILQGVLIAMLSVCILVGVAVGVFFATYQATMEFDIGAKTGKVMKGASGYLYGIAENGVPSAEMVESLDITTVAQKVPGGLQHPIGDMDDAAPMLQNTKYNVVYLQDVYDTWYYNHDGIMTARSKGTYDWQQFLDEDFLPKVEKVTKDLMQKPYADKVVYCLYNECDNGIWFGESQKDENPDNAYGVWCDYNMTGRDNFNSAWKQTYDLVKKINPKAVIGGPGFCDYGKDEIEYFLSFCKENDCLPEVMIYHELSVDSVYFFDEHIREYREMEKSLGIEELPIVITEYGMMSENGYPGSMVQLITQFENNKVYGDNAYWRLADNLNDNCADTNMPNAQWWLMRWYTDMKGETVQGTNKDILSSNFKNYFKYDLDSLSFNGFMGIASVSDSGDEIDVVCGGGEKKSKVVLKHLSAAGLKGKTVKITVEETVYQGLYGEVSAPVVLKEYTQKAGDTLSVSIGKVDAANAYHVVVKEMDETVSSFNNDNRPARFEFEEGTLLGDAYLYNSYAPASGGKNEDGNDLVGGMEKNGDGVELTFTVPAYGDYNLDIIYGNSNDGATPDDRADTELDLTLDGESAVTVGLANTIRSEYTSCYSFGTYTLSKGKHTLKAEHSSGTCVLDSLLVYQAQETAPVALLEDEDRTDSGNRSFLAVVPEDKYYQLTLAAGAYTVNVDGTNIATDANGTATLFLKRGLNYLDIATDKAVQPVLSATEEEVHFVPATALSLSGSATLGNAEEPYVDGITCNGGAAEYTVNAEEDGDFCLTLLYANNEEGGVHDYNVDLIEEYVTVSVNGKKVQNLYCRNTYSWDTYKTATCTVPLNKGENKITLSNDGAKKFNRRDTRAPRIRALSVNALTP